MTLYQQFETLGYKQLTLQDGINDLLHLQHELKRSTTYANAWGMTALICNAVLIPANAIINAFEVRKATSVYQHLVKILYDNYSKSGSRIDSSFAKKGLSTLKQIITEELTRKKLAEFVPGVNIIIGLAEDATALIETTQKVNSGSAEMKEISVRLQRQIDSVYFELFQISLRRAEIIDRLQRVAVTA